MSTPTNQLSNFETKQEGAGGSYGPGTHTLAPEISIREWYEGTKKILGDRKSYKHRLEMMVIVGAEPVFE